MIKIITFLLAFIAISTTFSQDFEEFMKVVAEDRDVDDRLGWSVDIDGDFAVAGAYGDDYGDANPNMGSVYIYERIGGSWEEIQKIHNSDQDDYDRFGWSVAIDGDYIIVGAYAEDHDALDGAIMSRAGSAYIFERNDEGEWLEVEKLVAADRAIDDEFGWSVAIHGTTAVVGAHTDDKNALGFGYLYHAGSAYIFDRDIDGNWTQSQKVVASDRSTGIEYAPDHEDWNDRFGESVGIWNDYLIVGAPFAGKGYMFERSGGIWSEVSYLVYPDLYAFDRAAPVSIDSTTAVLGASTEDQNEIEEEALMNAGGAAIYRRIDGDWEFIQKIVASDRSAGDHFGISVTIDGNHIAIGAHQDNHDEDTDGDLENAGSIYIFELMDDGTYFERNKLDASDRAIEDQLGISVSLSNGILISGAFQQDYLPDGGSFVEDAGAAYFYVGGDYCTPVYSSQDPIICSGGSFEVGEHTYDATGVYTDIFDSVEGCDSIVTTTLTVEDPIFFEQEVTICFGGSYEIGDSVYTEFGFYLNELSTDEGCDSIVSTLLFVDDPIEYEQDIVLCNGSSIIVGDSEYDSEGTYTDYLSTDEGCDSTVITHIEVEEMLNTDVTVDGLDFHAEATGVFYQWISCEPYEVIDGETNQNYSPEESGSYAVIITDGDCSDTSECIVSTVGINESYLGATIQIYPNPTNGAFVVSGADLVNSKIQVFNVVGELIYESVTTNNKTIQINILDQSSGIYLLRITNVNGTFVEKIRFN